MSANNALLVSVTSKGSSSKGVSAKPLDDIQNENICNNVLNQGKSAFKSVMETKWTNNDAEGSNEIEYIESKDLKDVENVQACLTTLLDRLDSKDWLVTCEALTNVRQLLTFHRDSMFPLLGNVVTLTVKSIKNPRSALCKTAIMTSADLFKGYQDQMIDLLDPLLLQLLLKASQDKKFVCEAAENALTSMTAWISPKLCLEKLEPYLKHKNPRIRAKASMCLYRSVNMLGQEGIKDYGLEKLIQIAAAQFNDRLPEAREAARTLCLELRAVHDKFFPLDQTQPDSCAASASDAWEQFCVSKLSPVIAQAVLRVTSLAT